jgi:ribosomal protein L7/L12
LNLTPEQKRELERLIASGEKIAAIKRFREITGVGLQEALHAVTQLEGGPQIRDSARAFSLLLDPKRVQQAETAAMAAIREGDIVAAIRAYRQHTQIGLKEAKGAVDALSLAHRTGGRINPKAAASVIAMVARGDRDGALTQLMSQSGYDEAEARDVLKTIGGLQLGGAALGAGCVRILLALIVLAIVAAAILSEIGGR